MHVASPVVGLCITVSVAFAQAPTATIQGDAYLVQKGGGVVPIAGQPIALLPFGKSKWASIGAFGRSEQVIGDSIYARYSRISQSYDSTQEWLSVPRALSDSVRKE
jgi:hypothetical protein